MQQIHLLTIAVAVGAFFVVTAFLSIKGSEPTYQVEEEFAGYYYGGLEASDFYPCKFEESWLVWPQNEFLAREYRRITGIQVESGENIVPIYVELRGYYSELGEYGHFGLADRELGVLEVTFTDRVYETEGATGELLKRCKPGSEHGPVVVFEYD